MKVYNSTKPSKFNNSRQYTPTFQVSGWEKCHKKRTNWNFGTLTKFLNVLNIHKQLYLAWTALGAWVATIWRRPFSNLYNATDLQKCYWHLKWISQFPFQNIKWKRKNSFQVRYFWLPDKVFLWKLFKWDGKNQNVWWKIEIWQNRSVCSLHIALMQLVFLMSFEFKRLGQIRFYTSKQSQYLCLECSQNLKIQNFQVL